MICWRLAAGGSSWSITSICLLWPSRIAPPKIDDQSKADRLSTLTERVGQRSRDGRVRSRTIMPAALAATLLASACSVGPDYKRPSLWSPLSWAGFGSHGRDDARSGRRASVSRRVSLPVERAPDPHWWDQFHDREL